MENSTHWTPSPEANLLGFTDKDTINAYEAKGITKAELFVFELEVEQPLSTSLLLQIHRIAFEELYDWAGQWRITYVMVGQLQPPPPNQVLQLMYQFLDNLNFKISIAQNLEDHVSCLIFAHYEFVKIHPFVNGNGRTGRILMNLVALKLGYQPLELYHRAGESRKVYIEAMKQADVGNYEALKSLILIELTPF
jgi:cell filamentation protein